MVFLEYLDALHRPLAILGAPPLGSWLSPPGPPLDRATVLASPALLSSLACWPNRAASGHVLEFLYYFEHVSSSPRSRHRHRAGAVVRYLLSFGRIFAPALVALWLLLSVRASLPRSCLVLLAGLLPMGARRSAWLACVIYGRVGVTPLANLRPIDAQVSYRPDMDDFYVPDTPEKDWLLYDNVPCKITPWALARAPLPLLTDIASLPDAVVEHSCDLLDYPLAIYRVLLPLLAAADELMNDLKGYSLLDWSRFASRGYLACTLPYLDRCLPYDMFACMVRFAPSLFLEIQDCQFLCTAWPKYEALRHERLAAVTRQLYEQTPLDGLTIELVLEYQRLPADDQYDSDSTPLFDYGSQLRRLRRRSEIRNF